LLLRPGGNDNGYEEEGSQEVQEEGSQEVDQESQESWQEEEEEVNKR
jgi:hypothetical protein